MLDPGRGEWVKERDRVFALGDGVKKGKNQRIWKKESNKETEERKSNKDKEAETLNRKEEKVKKERKKESSCDSSMVGMVACYRGGPRFNSRQGR